MPGKSLEILREALSDARHRERGHTDALAAARVEIADLEATLIKLGESVDDTPRLKAVMEAAMAAAERMLLGEPKAWSWDDDADWAIWGTVPPDLEPFDATWLQTCAGVTQAQVETFLAREIAAKRICFAPNLGLHACTESGRFVVEIARRRALDALKAAPAPETP